MNIQVNGTAREVPAGTTVAQLLQILNLDPRHLAVERNQNLVPRRQHGECELQEQDQVEIVTLVGGG